MILKKSDNEKINIKKIKMILKLKIMLINKNLSFKEV